MIGAAAADGADPDIEYRLSIGGCLAGLRATIEHTRAAADAWSTGDDRAAPLDTADGALRRARAQSVALHTLLPGHSRRVRLADRAVERVAEALAVVRGLPPLALDLDQRPDEDATDAEEALLLVVDRAFGAAERAVLAADASTVGR